MDMVPQPELGGTTSAVGFGCAGLGGRLGMADSVRLLEEAAAAGIVHIDVARSYGHGGAERVVGRFLRNRRNEFFVVSKLGILPPTRSLAREVAVGLARRAIRIAPTLRHRLSRRAAEEATAGAFDVGSARDSLHASLDAMETDHLDVLLLHECSRDDLTDELVSWLDGVVREGKTRAWGLATTPTQTREILCGRQPYAVNVASSAGQPNDDVLAVPGPRLRVIHSVIGSDLAMVRRYLLNATAREKWEERIGESLAPQQAPTVLMAAARGRNPDGVVLAGTQRVEHIAPLAAAGDRRPDPAYARTVGDLMVEAAHWASL